MAHHPAFSRMFRRPSVAAIVIALLLAAVGHLIDSYGVLEPLGRFTDHLHRSLESFDATRVGGEFYFRLTGCTAIAGDGVYGVDCGQSGLSWSRILQALHPVKLLKTAAATAGVVWDGSTTLGVVLYAVAVLASGIWLGSRLLADEPVNLVAWTLLLLLTPALASLVSLALKWVLFLFVLVFSQVLAGIAWVAATFGSALAWLQTGWKVFKRAQQIDAMALAAQPVPDGSQKPPTPTGG